MRLLIDDTLATAPFAYPLTAGWPTPANGPTVAARPRLRAADLAADDAALLPAAEIAHCQETHAVVPAVAIVLGAVGSVAMRTPVRPDEVERSPVRLLGTSGTAELLARATLRPFYGIEPTAWPATDDDPGAAEAQVSVVEGAEALRPTEAGFAEDLCRAWLILTDLPVVGHVLVAPLAATPADLAPVLAALAALRQASQERRREWRSALAAAHDLPLDRLNAFFAGQRHALDPNDRRALLQLHQRGARGSAYPPLTALRFLDPDPAPA